MDPPDGPSELMIHPRCTCLPIFNVLEANKIYKKNEALHPSSNLRVDVTVENIHIPIQLAKSARVESDSAVSMHFD